MNNLPIEELEIKIAFLERHIEEQDRVIHGLHNDLRDLRRELQRLDQRINQDQSDGPSFPADERPPHY